VEILRWVLFLGMVFHKLLWEVLKRTDGVTKVAKQSEATLSRKFVKLLKSMVLAFLLVQTLFLEILPISSHATTLSVLGTAIYLTGLTMAVIGRVQLGRNWIDMEDCQIMPAQSLVTSGIYRYVRHPIYGGDLLLLIGLQLALNSWLVLGALVPVLVVMRQVLREESILSETFPDYPFYCQQSKRFIPFLI